MDYKCDYCDRDTKVNLISEKVEKDVYVYYMQCKYCEHKHIVYFLNNRARRLQAKIRKNSINSKANRLELEKIMDDLYDRYSKRVQE